MKDFPLENFIRTWACLVAVVDLRQGTKPMLIKFYKKIGVMHQLIAYELATTTVNDTVMAIYKYPYLKGDSNEQP